jgi:hypothetical protein
MAISGGPARPRTTRKNTKVDKIDGFTGDELTIQKL